MKSRRQGSTKPKTNLKKLKTGGLKKGVVKRATKKGLRIRRRSVKRMRRGGTTILYMFILYVLGLVGCVSMTLFLDLVSPDLRPLIVAMFEVFTRGGAVASQILQTIVGFFFRIGSGIIITAVDAIDSKTAATFAFLYFCAFFWRTDNQITLMNQRIQTAGVRDAAQRATISNAVAKYLAKIQLARENAAGREGAVLPGVAGAPAAAVAPPNTNDAIDRIADGSPDDAYGMGRIAMVLGTLDDAELTAAHTAMIGQLGHLAIERDILNRALTAALTTAGVMNRAVVDGTIAANVVVRTVQGTVNLMNRALTPLARVLTRMRARYNQTGTVAELQTAVEILNRQLDDDFLQRARAAILNPPEGADPVAFNAARLAAHRQRARALIRGGNVLPPGQGVLVPGAAGIGGRPVPRVGGGPTEEDIRDFVGNQPILGELREILDDCDGSPVNVAAAEREWYQMIPAGHHVQEISQMWEDANGVPRGAYAYELPVEPARLQVAPLTSMEDDLPVAPAKPQFAPAHLTPPPMYKGDEAMSTPRPRYKEEPLKLKIDFDKIIEELEKTPTEKFDISNFRRLVKNPEFTTELISDLTKKYRGKIPVNQEVIENLKKLSQVVR